MKELYAEKDSNSDFDEHFAWTWVESWLIEMQSEEYRVKSKAVGK